MPEEGPRSPMPPVNESPLPTTPPGGLLAPANIEIRPLSENVTLFDKSAVKSQRSCGSWFQKAVEVTEVTTMEQPINNQARAEAYPIIAGHLGSELLSQRFKALLNTYRGFLSNLNGTYARVEIGGPIIDLLGRGRLTHLVIPHHWLGIPDGGTAINREFPAGSTKDLVQMLALDKSGQLGLVLTDGKKNLYFPESDLTYNATLPLPPAIVQAVNGDQLTPEGLRKAIKKRRVVMQGVDKQGNKVALRVLQSPINTIGGIGTSKFLRVNGQITKGSELLNRFQVGTVAKGVGFLHTHFDFTEQELEQNPHIKELLSRGIPLEKLLGLLSPQDAAVLRNTNIKTQSADVARQIVSGVMPVIRQKNGEVSVGLPRWFSLVRMPAGMGRTFSQILDRAFTETRPNEVVPALQDYFEMMDELSLPAGTMPEDIMGITDINNIEAHVIPSLDLASVLGTGTKSGNGYSTGAYSLTDRLVGMTAGKPQLEQAAVVPLPAENGLNSEVSTAMVPKRPKSSVATKSRKIF